MTYPWLWEARGTKYPVQGGEPRPARVQVGAASGSAAPPPRERAERGLEEDPRAPYRKFPNAQRVRYGANPARPGTPRHARYAAYSGATNLQEARRLGATSQDISMDVAAGALVLL